jgi:sodium/hydrogen antiporter
VGTFEVMTFTLWALIVGVLLIGMALAGSVLRRLPLSTAMLYLAAGVALGPVGVALINLDPLDHPTWLERITEIAVLISLFTAGLKLRVPLRRPIWRLPLRLATLSMIATVGLIAVVGVVGLGLPLGAAVLLGAILAPTDPVLAADVQVENPHDRDTVRFGLTGEAGLNDGTAFPFVMLGLGLLGLHELGGGLRWLAVDVVWATAAGLGVGALAGLLVSRLVLYLRREYGEAVGLDEFLGLGLIALSYGLAVLVHGYGFLAVFAAGLALRMVERHESGDRPVTPPMIDDEHEAATAPETAPAYMAQSVLGFNEALERIAEVAVVLLIGGLLAGRLLPLEDIWFVPLLLLVIRPLSVLAGLVGSGLAPVRRGLVSWFGIRGIGSIYYLMFAVSHGLPEDLAQRLIALTLTTVAVSVVVHGVSVTPLMSWYSRRQQPRPAQQAPAP